MQQTRQVLFVEDSAGDALFTAQILTEAVLPVRLTVARDGVQALSMLANPSFKPALIILDLNLPRLSGFDVLERNVRRDIPVVIFTVSANPADRDRAFALGAKEYVEKPTDLDAYRSAVLAMIDKWAFPAREADGAATS
jgi:CheY-like chemotaxis protein